MAEDKPAKAAPGAQEQQTPHKGHPVKKQIAFILFGQQHTAALWRDVLVDVYATLAAQHGAAFADAAFTVKGRTRQYVAASPDGMIAPAQIPGTELWIEANQSAKSVVQVIGKLLVALGHTPEEFKIDVVG